MSLATSDHAEVLIAGSSCGLLSYGLSHAAQSGEGERQDFPHGAECEGSSLKREAFRVGGLARVCLDQLQSLGISPFRAPRSRTQLVSSASRARSIWRAR
jgi:hypothetical protein